MKKAKHKASRLSGKSTNQEIIRWTESHDVFDRLTKGVSEDEKDHGDLNAVLRNGDFPRQYRPRRKPHTAVPPPSGFGKLADRKERSAMLSQDC
jgi:hypothetical protein